MHMLLDKLGVSPELQAFFDANELCFNYGVEEEIYGADFHHVPVTRDLWMAGNNPATELIVTSSAMEAIAYMTVNAWRHPSPAGLSFIAVGLRPQAEQLHWIGKYCLKRKITLVFPNDVCGKITDIIIAAGVRQKAVKPRWKNDKVDLLMGGLIIELPVDKISLNFFEKAASLRTGIKTLKPKRFNTFLDQLHDDSKP
ncbi:hypothetical protein DYU05_06620 [Mucilaginibacter terrenus]|uniref:Uncharacterized protein n=1 Tax=Mucilaginibacter terrenus TaxID=2482727 RepID=A0A3E2NW81_9SPHI|nr:hypothetical protein [Mucilaginibacter terrenus]RFZ85268.1 hypothetical protein DYU05_06620 [Mucilaginibacter terrenus]